MSMADVAQFNRIFGLDDYEAYLRRKPKEPFVDPRRVLYMLEHLAMDLSVGPLSEDMKDPSLEDVQRFISYVYRFAHVGTGMTVCKHPDWETEFLKLERDLIQSGRMTPFERRIHPMAIIETIKKNKIEAMKAGRTVEKDVLSYVLGAVQNLQMTANQAGKPVVDEQVYRIMRDVIVNNDANLEKLTDNDALKAKLLEENRILTALVPSVLTLEQVRTKLSTQADAIRAAKNEGAAIGVCMGFFKKSGDSVDGNMVRQVAQEIRNATAVQAEGQLGSNDGGTEGGV